jgi:chloramphenicol-sensitive protein RarD
MSTCAPPIRRARPGRRAGSGAARLCENVGVTEPLNRKGLAYAITAYAVWGMFPILMDELRPAGAVEIVAHRAAWSLVVCLFLVAVTRRWRPLLAALRNPRTMMTLALAAALIALNWGVMLYAVLTDRVADSSLGYYINPLITVALGVLVLREHLHKAQAFAIGLAGVAIVVVGIELGGVPWIAPTLACSFALYSLVKKRIGATVDALTGFTIETIALMPVALVIFLVLAHRGTGTWGVFGIDHDLWLASTGIWTAGALLIFAAGASRLPLYVVGLIQFLTPTISFILAVTYFGEPMPTTRWAGFVLVWVALVIVTVDSWRRSRASATARAAIIVNEPE